MVEPGGCGVPNINSLFFIDFLQNVAISHLLQHNKPPPNLSGLKRFSCPQFCGFAIWTGLSRGGLALLHVLAGELRAGGTKMALFMCGALVLTASWSASGALQVTFLYLLPLHSVV